MTAVANAIKKVATGPHLCEDLSVEETKAAMTETLSGKAAPVQAAIFYIGLRIKRETDVENLGVYRAIQAAKTQLESNMAQLLVIADPFNGYNRHCPIHAFLQAVLAWIADAAGFDSALIVRGIEAGILPTLREPANCFQSYRELAEPCELDPSDFGLARTTRGVLPVDEETVTALETIEPGLRGLAGQTGPAFDSLIYGGALGLWHCGIQPSKQQAAEHVRHVIQSGRAKAVFQNVIS
jgi:anthranilate phosphoribosyltransferase